MKPRVTATRIKTPAPTPTSGARRDPPRDAAPMPTPQPSANPSPKEVCDPRVLGAAGAPLPALARLEVAAQPPGARAADASDETPRDAKLAPSQQMRQQPVVAQKVHPPPHTRALLGCTSASEAREGGHCARGTRPSAASARTPSLCASPHSFDAPPPSPLSLCYFPPFPSGPCHR